MTKKQQTITIPLAYTASFEGIDYNELTFRRMKARDALVAEDEEDEAKAGFLLYATLADVPMGVIEDLDVDDLVNIAEKVAPFLGKAGVAAMKKQKAIQTESPGET